jgi:hypothetical protein
MLTIVKVTGALLIAMEQASKHAAENGEVAG